ncbi:repressor LexA [Bradyrhizobium elkanii USDA 61]|uniref:LexA family protein n=2 Tax=Bradyrhizobium elkanii TaxID=29448 RepID=UPI002A153017|nr:repressor LexA [Bradyrhizobium elkanii]MCS4012416.1 repressor LexA [Bradyrhizobium elkanii USDA 61]MCS3567028.1 repressor LexA [Bradyrhizobium elkanii]MCS3585582.1 repressor LexA [Bradyrhizobium elkanii]MCS3724890.1 repressor LexA [Bradyrhizobium elkanii]
MATAEPGEILPLSTPHSNPVGRMSLSMTKASSSTPSGKWGRLVSACGVRTYSAFVSSILLPRITEKQGHYLAFIHTYSFMFGQPPAEKDIQRHFRVSPPSVHQMILTLERNGFIRRQPGVPRSIEILVAPENLPILEWLGIKTSQSL